MPTLESGLHVAVDAVGIRRFSGGAVVLMDLIDALASSDDVHRVTLFASPVHRRDFLLPEHPKVDAVLCTAEDASRLELLRWVTSGLGRACEQRRADGVVSLNSLGTSNSKTVVLFQQQLMFAPEAVARMPLAFRARLRALRALSRRACRRAALVIAQAPHVARSLAEEFAVDPARIRVVVPDVRWPEMDSPSTVPELRAPSLLYVGTDDPYKSLDTVLVAFARLRARFPELELALTLPESEKVSLPGVRCLGTLPRADVRRLLAQAAALVMPSLAETIGLPLLEALDVGCPIIAADLPYARDVCGDAGVYFEPANAMSCASACESVLNDSGLRARLVASGRARAHAYRDARPYPELARLICQTLGSGT